MSSKGGAGTASPAPPSQKADAGPPSKAPSSKPTPARSKAQAKPKKAGASKDDDLFGFDGVALRHAVPLSRKPARGKTTKIVCPMCETAGFASADVSGREVKCVNPECLVPIFKAPEIEKKAPEPVEPEPETGMPLTVKLGIGFGVAACLAAVAWFVFLKPEGGSPVNEPAGGEVATAPSGTTGGAPSPDAGGEPQKHTADPSTAEEPVEVAPQLSPSEITDLALQAMVAASQQQERNRSKPFCRRLTAEAYAAVGNFSEAMHQVQQLAKVGESVPYYQIPPLVAIAWGKLGAGDSEGAQQVAANAWSLADKIPKFGQIAVDSAVDLGTLLVALKRSPDAKSVIESHLGQGTWAELSALLRAVFANGTYDLDGAVAAEPIVPWNAPEWVAVVETLVTRNYGDAALEWVKSIDDPEVRTDGLIAWATAILRGTALSAGRDPVSEIQTAASELDSVFVAKMFARVAFLQANAGSADAAQKSLLKATEALSQVPVPDAFVLPTMEDLYDLKPENLVRLRIAAVAAAEIARVEALMQRHEAAWTSLSKALQYLRASAPSVTAAQNRNDEFSRRGRAAIESALANILDLRTDEQARIAANKYRKQCQDVLAGAKLRFDLQVQLLSQASQWSQIEPIWNEISAKVKADDENQNEPYFSTSLPSILATRARATKNEALAKTIESAAGENSPADRFGVLQQETSQLVTDGKLATAAAKKIDLYVGKNRDDSERAFQWVLQLACRLVKEKQVEQAFNLLAGLENPVWRETGLQLTAALAARNGLAASAWKFAADKSKRLPATEQVALMYGLIVALSLSK